jgi:hypothetical protein
VYRGPGDEHLRDQPCYPLMPVESAEDELEVVMACGCRSIVPRWMLEPR